VKARAGLILYEDDLARIVLVDDDERPGFCRVILRRHVAETTDLSPDDRRHLMDMVFATEKAARDIVAPDKMNVASLGNVVPHVHWHVIPRRRDDAHFPNPIWGTRLRDPLAAAPSAESLRQVARRDRPRTLRLRTRCRRGSGNAASIQRVNSGVVRSRAKSGSSRNSARGRGFDCFRPSATARSSNARARASAFTAAWAQAAL
jgi:diadenosine tetraphosphate (Ap4A) HIT family hydrolase